MKKIFVSSTFRDMQYERDILHESVLPRLNAAALEYGDALSLCDLRWGVDTSELSEAESARKVLSVCLDEIDRCRPYMIIIIGARYGWIPDDATTKDLVRQRIESLRDLKRSVTEMEIEYGALSRKLDGHCLFYFRNADYSKFPGNYQSESPEHERLMLELRQRIRRLTGDKDLREYTISWNPETRKPEGIETFAEMVTEDVTALMTREWKARLEMSVWDKDALLQWNQAEEKAQQFAAREAFAASVIERSRENDSLIALRGASGCGKSMLMARLAVELRDAGEAVLPYFCGSSQLTGTAVNLARSVIAGIRKELGEDPGNPENENISGDSAEDSLAESLSEWVSRYNTKGERPLTILIDAVDQLAPDRFRDQFRFLPPVSGGKVRVILSMLDSFAVPAGLQIEMISIGELDDKEKAEVIRGILGFQSKELDGSVIDRISAKKASGNPLYLSILLRRLLMMDREDFAWIVSHGDGQKAITAYEIKLIDEMPEELQNAALQVIDHALEKMNRISIRAAAAFISMSRFGMRPEDVQGIIRRWSSGRESLSLLDFSLFTGYLRNFFLVREDGRYDFSHRIIKEAMLLHWKKPQFLHGQIALWLTVLDEKDEIRRSERIWHSFGGRMSLFFDCMRGSDEALLPAAQTLKDCLARDKEGWIREQIVSLSQKSPEEIRPQIHFLLDIFPKAVTGTWDELIAERTVLRALRDLLEEQGKSWPDHALVKEDGFLCLCRLGEVCRKMGERYKAEARECLEKVCRDCGREEVQKELETGMKRGKADLLMQAFRLLADICTEEGRHEEALDLLDRYRVIDQAVCGRYRYDIREYMRMPKAKAMKQNNPRFISLARARFSSGAPDRKRSAMTLLEGRIAEMEELPEKDKDAVREELIRSKETKAWLLQQMKEPLFLHEAEILGEEIIAYREAQLARDPGGESLARLSRACRQAGEIALALGDPESRKKSFALAMRSVKLEQQRSVLLGTEESLCSLLDSYDRLERLYVSDGAKKALETAAAISGIRVRLSAAGYKRWPSEKLLRMYFDSCLAAARHYLDVNDKEAGKKAMEFGKRCRAYAARPEAGAYYRLNADRIWGQTAVYFGGEKNLQTASDVFRRAIQTAEELYAKDPESAEIQLKAGDLPDCRMRLADTLTKRRERTETEEEIEDLYRQALEGFEQAHGKHPEDQEMAEGLMICLQHAADYQMRAGRPEKAEALLARADGLSERLSSGSTRADIWERRSAILASRVQAAKKLGGEKEADNIARLSGELLNVARQAGISHPCAGNLVALADCYGNWAGAELKRPEPDERKALSLYDSCFAYARKACELFPGAESGAAYMKWAREAMTLYLGQKEDHFWGQGTRTMLQGFRLLKKAGQRCPEGEDPEEYRDKLCELGQKEAERVNALMQNFLKTPGIKSYFKSLCYGICGFTFIHKIDVHRLQKGMDENETDEFIADQLLYAAVQITNSRNAISNVETETVYEDLMRKLFPAAVRLAEENPSAANRKRVIYAANVQANYTALLASSKNEEILEALREGERQAEALLAEGDPEARPLAKMIYESLTAAWSVAGPIRYAGKILEYKRKIKNIGG